MSKVIPFKQQLKMLSEVAGFCCALVQVHVVWCGVVWCGVNPSMTGLGVACCSRLGAAGRRSNPISLG